MSYWDNLLFQDRRYFSPVCCLSGGGGDGDRNVFCHASPSALALTLACKVDSGQLQSSRVLLAQFDDPEREVCSFTRALDPRADMPQGHQLTTVQFGLSSHSSAERIYVFGHAFYEVDLPQPQQQQQQQQSQHHLQQQTFHHHHQQQLQERQNHHLQEQFFYQDGDLQLNVSIHVLPMEGDNNHQQQQEPQQQQHHHQAEPGQQLPPMEIFSFNQLSLVNPIEGRVECTLRLASCNATVHCSNCSGPELCKGKVRSRFGKGRY